jgi:Flp pilus assembly protein TadG
MIRSRTLFYRDVAGVVALEFAICAPVLFWLIFCTIDVGIATWMWQVLEATASEAARCAGINATACKNATTAPINTQTYAVSAATALGLSAVTTSNVIVSTGAAAQTVCNTTASVVSVSVSYTYVPVVLPLSSSLSASACFPLAN